MSVAAIHQPQYLPYLGFFHKITQSDVFVILDDTQFQKRGVQHRNRIKTREGWQWLTVPVLRHSAQPIRDVALDPTAPWQRRHINALRSNYGRAPYFARYGQEIDGLLNQPWVSLCELDMALIRWVMAILSIDTPVRFASELNVTGTGSERLAGLCRAVNADRYLSGSGGRRYMDMEVFERNSVRVLWQAFDEPSYPQLFPTLGFIPDLSVIDALFCYGPDSRRFVE
jgi:hypothetical protein